jgi:tRNA A-37 threonylcarbamoyl transferase component Bud32/membrane-associated phospholipid phosphatase
MTIDHTRDHQGTRPSLSNVGVDTRLRLGRITVLERRRRPSGEAASMPRDLDRTVGIWATIAAVIAALNGLAIAFDGVADFWIRIDDAVLDGFVDLRTRAVTPTMEALNSLGSEWTTRVLRWGMLAVLVVYARWRHLVVGLGAILTAEFLARRIADGVDRIPVADSVRTAATAPMPSLPVAALVVTLVVAGYALVPKGRLRNAWFGTSAVAIALRGVARTYLGYEHPTDVAVAVVVGVGVGLLAFRVFVPSKVFPISYERKSAAHLNVQGPRQVAIRQALERQLLDTASPENQAVRRAVHDQLGCDVLGCELVDFKPFGLDGSAGSTPLRIRVAGDPDAYLFGKLYATSHLRSDRWYKAFRSVAYGSLEDEVPFTSVRRLVQYEDYMLRVMSDAGLPVPQPFGFVEVQPGREYLLVTEFIDGAREIGDVDASDELIHKSLAIVRQLWDAGLAHRDIKPANLLVRGDEVYLIDTAFAMLRPSPWRQAVDLANMMLLLALRSDTRTVYEHAVQHFDPNDVAEAFAATRGITIPRQLQVALKEKRTEGIDILEEFRSLGPDCPRIHIQRWSARRMATTALLLGAGTLFGLLLVDNLSNANFF